MTPTIHQRCWNHDSREAVCRCPACSRSYCRECVSEHEARLLCAACLNAIARTTTPRRSRMGRFVPAGMLIAGLVLAWVAFYSAGQAMNLLVSRLEQSAWQSR